MMNICPCCEKTTNQNFMFDTTSGTLMIDGKLIHFTKNQAALFMLLLKHKGSVVTNDALMDTVYWLHSSSERPDKEIIKIYLCKMRKELEGTRVNINTIWSEGFKLVIEEMAS